MKKIALATLLAASTAIASAQITVSGKIGEYIDSTKTGSTTVKSMVAEPTSNIKFSISETLGGGLTASAVVDTKLAANDPKSVDTQLGDRQSTVGLASKLGSINLGRNTHGVWNTLSSTDVFSGFYGTISEDVHNARGKRLSNATFITVEPMKNINGSYARDTVTEATTYTVGGTLGPLSASFARYELGTTKSDVIGAGTRLLGARLGLLYSSDIVAGVTTKGTSIGAAYKLASPLTLKASYGTRTGGTGNVTAYNVGTEYAFSKRTMAQVVYRNVNNPNTSADIKEYGIGMVHSF
jgi:predicted porin